ncbi:MAG: hypothetical protein CL623_12295 [Arcobacter sp.]|nr:hypothetical protein [Arcobacter sp.]
MQLKLIDYESKLHQDFLNFFNKENYNNKNLEELFHLYCNKLNKQFSSQKYKVLISKELKSTTNNIVNEIKKDFENGNIDTLNKRLSKASIKEDENDLLLNNWGIYHLHLGAIRESSFSGRTGLLLFIKIIDNKVYFLDLKEHGNFSSIDFIKIMHNNWSQEIENFKIKDIVDIEPKPTEEEVFQCWKVGLNIALTFIDNKNNEVSYLPLSGGVNLGKSPINATSKWIYLLRTLPEIDNKVNSKCYLRFDYVNKKFHIEDENNDVLYTLDFNSL